MFQMGKVYLLRSPAQVLPLVRKLKEGEIQLTDHDRKMTPHFSGFITCWDQVHAFGGTTAGDTSSFICLSHLEKYIIYSGSDRYPLKPTGENKDYS